MSLNHLITALVVVLPMVLSDKPDPLCPYHSHKLTYFVFPGDCTKFYQCYDGLKSTMKCNKGYYWNQEEIACDYKSIVHCDNQTTESKVGENEKTVHNHTTESKAGENETTADKPDPLCPYPSHKLTYFVFPGDCTKFYQCYDGLKSTMECNKGYYWNQEEIACDYKSRVHCDNQTTESKAGENEKTVHNHTTESKTGENKKTVHDLCSSTSNETTFFVYPGDCTKYYVCNNGEKDEMQCPSPLYWNQDKKLCDYSCNNQTTESKAGENEKTVPYPRIESRVDEIKVPAKTRDPLCPYPSDEITFFVFPGDCSKYYECYKGDKYTMRCPQDLYWNQELKTCDYRSHVHCDNQTTESKAGVTEKTVQTSDPLCPYPSDEITFFVCPEDCSKYYECYEGTKYTMRCPHDLFWNQELKTCDYRDHAHCTTGA